MIVTIWHNVATDSTGRRLGYLDGYTDGHPLVPVASYEVPANSYYLHGSWPNERACEEAFEIFNIGDDPALNGSIAVELRKIALVYRARGNRSLSVGDVVQVSLGGSAEWFAVASFGFDKITEPRWFALDSSSHGTTPKAKN